MVRTRQKPSRNHDSVSLMTRLGSLVGSIVIICLSCSPGGNSATNSSVSSPVPSEDSPLTSINEMTAQSDYSRFFHGSAHHARLPCLLCHRRETNAPRPAMPGSGHLPCAGCHSQQFAHSESPMCAICHTDASSGALKPFPRMRSFRVNFDHARHMGMSGVTCATCHRPSRGGVAFSIPVSFSAHTTCYRCHTPRARAQGRDISSCGACHQLGRYTRTPVLRRAFNMSFSHRNHSSTQKLNCNDCHLIRAGQPQRRQVTSPEAAQHHASGRTQSCITCHNGTKAFGGDDFSVCTRCHTGKTWQF